MSLKVEIRPMTEADVPEWGRMRIALWPACAGIENETEMAGILAAGNDALVLIALSGRRAIGFAELSERDCVEGCDEGPAAYLEGWYVAPGYRESGVGRALVDAAIDWANERGRSWLGSDVEIDNLVSQAAHAALGFEETGRIVTYRMNVRS